MVMRHQKDRVLRFSLSRLKGANGTDKSLRSRQLTHRDVLLELGLNHFALSFEQKILATDVRHRKTDNLGVFKWFLLSSRVYDRQGLSP